MLCLNRSKDTAVSCIYTWPTWVPRYLQPLEESYCEVQVPEWQSRQELRLVLIETKVLRRNKCSVLCNVGSQFPGLSLDQSQGADSQYGGQRNWETFLNFRT